MLGVGGNATGARKWRGDRRGQELLLAAGAAIAGRGRRRTRLGLRGDDGDALGWVAMPLLLGNGAVTGVTSHSCWGWEAEDEVLALWGRLMRVGGTGVGLDV